MARVRVRLSAFADRDLEAILDHGVAEFGVDIAAAWLDGFNAVLVLLADYPRIGRERPGLSPGLRSRSYRSHCLYYEQLEDELLILRILHQRMDPNRHF